MSNVLVLKLYGLRQGEQARCTALSRETVRFEVPALAEQVRYVMLRTYQGLQKKKTYRICFAFANENTCLPQKLQGFEWPW